MFNKKILLALFFSILNCHVFAIPSRELPQCIDVEYVKNTVLTDAEYDAGTGKYLTYGEYFKVNNRNWIVVDGFFPADHEGEALEKGQDLLRKAKQPHSKHAKQMMDWHYCMYYSSHTWFHDREVVAMTPRRDFKESSNFQEAYKQIIKSKRVEK